MTQHELYIDGNLIDVGSDFDIALLYQNYVFSDLTEMASNRSYSVKIPLTISNLKAIGYSALEDVDTDYQYKYHEVIYYRNGFLLIDKGKAIITSIDDNINVAFSWGLIPALDRIKDKTFLDLDSGEYVEDSGYLSDKANYGYYSIDFGAGALLSGNDLEFRHPSIHNDYILKRIKYIFGLNIELSTKELIVPCIDRKGSKMVNGVESESQFKIVNTNNPFLYVDGFAYITYNNINLNYFTLTQFGTGYQQTKINILQTGILIFDPEKLKALGEFELRIQDFTTGDILNDQTPLKYAYLDYRYKYVEIEVEAGDILVFRFPGTGVQAIDGTFNLSFIPDKVSYYYHDRFPIFPNLPDMQLTDYLKALGIVNGVFFYPENGSIYGMSIDSIGTTGAYDWTEKLLNSSFLFNKAEQVEFTYNDVAQSNRLSWQDNTDVSIVSEGFIASANKSIDKSKDLITVPEFTASDQLNSTTPAIVPCYDSNKEFTDTPARLLIMRKQDGLMGGFFFTPYESLCFAGENGLIAKNYQLYKNVFKNPKYLKVDCLLNDLDLYNLDMKKLVYFEQFGNYYIILKIQAKKDNVSTCEFLRWTNVDTQPLTYEWTDYVCGIYNSQSAVSFYPTGYAYYFELSLSNGEIYSLLDEIDFFPAITKNEYATMGDDDKTNRISAFCSMIEKKYPILEIDRTKVIIENTDLCPIS